MPSVIWEQEADPLKLKLHFNTLGRSYYIAQPEVINQLVSSYDKLVRLHKDQQVFEADFTRLLGVAQKPGVARKQNAGSPMLHQEVCGIEQNGQWLGPDGWQSERQYVRLRPADDSGGTPPPPPVASRLLCTNCNTPNVLGAVVCRNCGLNTQFQPVYD